MSRSGLRKSLDLETSTPPGGKWLDDRLLPTDLGFYAQLCNQSFDVPPDRARVVASARSADRA
jgi:hypothetical protein